MTLETLHDVERYQQVWLIDHKTVIKALQPYVWRRTAVGMAYITANIAALVFAVFCWTQTSVPWFEGFSFVSLGLFVGYLVLLPIHENIHALTYRSFGARSVQVFYRWKNMTAYCVADRFVVNRRQMYWLCLNPFLVITPVLIVAALLTTGWWSLLFAGALVLHTSACGGDFAIVNWLATTPYADVYTYDDVAAEQTYFFAPIHS